MQTNEILQNLLTERYIKPIVVEGNYAACKSAALLNPESGTVFSVASDFLFMFQDQNRNGWLTIPNQLTINGKKYYPKLGDRIINNDGTTYSFTTKEAIIEMAYNYFKEYINHHFGIQTVIEGMSFFENSDDKTDKYFVVFQKFKSRIHPQIDAFISSN